jgi:hypothetical protein
VYEFERIRDKSGKGGRREERKNNKRKEKQQEEGKTTRVVGNLLPLLVPTKRTWKHA